ncbi:hypothetical protein CTA2_8167 [Colletotrichum tanaceti]|uniref:Uncharacterized protein n=1 Tax=Colletotrichum tanaceti TaxID=1306861 RepID=A0A4U6X6I0_9PEZI|nr:hypothetical protein CTA2_8167 [Colletotrichum tanaceti]TKW51038.1 hypothetical protein CTA1_3950 [Colletotrichum tanaceti]
MDFLDELESMAQSAVTNPDEPDYDDVKRWQFLFGYTYSDAARKIRDHRSNFARVQVPELHWDMVRAEKEAQGYDKESYEYSCGLAPSQKRTHAEKMKKPAIYLLKLEGSFSSPEDVRMVCGASPALSPTFSGTDDNGTAASFIEVDEATKKILLDYLSETGSTFQPTFIRCSKAEKDLSATSLHPTLGSEATLPQNRPSCLSGSKPDIRLLPAQDQYPVWYFFYGTLADPNVLENLLGVQNPAYLAANVRGGRLATWGGKYKALTDAPAYELGRVEGHAYLVTNKDQEDSLRWY